MSDATLLKGKGRRLSLSFSLYHSHIHIHLYIYTSIDIIYACLLVSPTYALAYMHYSTYIFIDLMPLSAPPSKLTLWLCWWDWIETRRVKLMIEQRSICLDFNKISVRFYVCRLYLYPYAFTHTNTAPPYIPTNTHYPYIRVLPSINCTAMSAIKLGKPTTVVLINGGQVAIDQIAQYSNTDAGESSALTLFLYCPLLLLLLLYFVEGDSRIQKRKMMTLRVKKLST